MYPGCRQRGAIARKITAYFPGAMLWELVEESRRLNRPIGWLIRSSWELARQRIRSLPVQDGES